MFRFTLRELFGLTAIALVSCVLTIIIAPADGVVNRVGVKAPYIVPNRPIPQ